MTRAVEVLLVDGDEDCRAIYSTILKHGGVSVSSATNGEEGWRCAVELQPKLVLIEIALPILDGLAVVERIRALPPAGRPIVVALTARVMSYEQHILREAGFDAVLLKPIAPISLLGAVRELLNSPMD